MSAKTQVTCAVRPAMPTEWSARASTACQVSRDGDAIVIENGFLAATIDAVTGVMTTVTNRLTGETLGLEGDQFGFEVDDQPGLVRRWVAGDGGPCPASISLAGSGGGQATVTVRFEAGDIGFEATYLLTSAHFWIERRFRLTLPHPVRLHALYHGRCQQPGLRPGWHELSLGKYDRPRLISQEKGGVFAGLGWWFYGVGDNGVYQNGDIRFTPREPVFETEPWYVGVFQREADEPFPGWFWYRSFLQRRKDEHDKQRWWCYWNAGWGQWTIEIDETAGRPYFDLCRRMGVRQIAFGSGYYGKPIEEYARIASESPVARENYALLRQQGLLAGCIEAGPVRDDWNDPAIAAKHHAALNRLAAEPAFGGFHFDYFYVPETFIAKWHTARYLRASREKLAFTECHLGMADYGPEYMREVLCNHTADFGTVDLAHFSNDWTGFLGFRQNRAGWQRRYEYLVPETGMYYFATNYHNGGHPKKFTDPEPAQLLYDGGSYAGCLNFHDPVGFRDSLMASIGFSPFVVFGYLDLHMPETDVVFARAALDWLAGNAEALRPGRVCHEDRDLCVLSKVVDGRGPLYVINYSGGAATLRLALHTETGRPAGVTPVYPRRGPEESVPDGGFLTVTVPGESVAIWDVNGSLRSLPPENPRPFPADVAGWARSGPGEWTGTVDIPDIREALDRARDPHLPRELLLIDIVGNPKSAADVQDIHPDLLRAGKLGDLPESYLRAMDIAGDRVDAWKAGPWAFADRVWLVYFPKAAPRLDRPFPQVTVNGIAIRFYPRVDNRSADPAGWTCPLLFADMTPHCRFGAANRISLNGIAEEGPPDCSVYAAVPR